MSALHDLYCRNCRAFDVDVAVDPTDLPFCVCGERFRIDWSHGQAPGTDIKGATVESLVHYEPGTNIPLTYSSTREIEKKMRSAGYEPVGDKVGGARYEHRLKGTLFSEVKHPVRKSSGGASA